MNKTYGFIGVGSMGGALARACCRAVGGKSVRVSNRTAEKARSLAAELGCVACTNDVIAASCGFIFLGVKPQLMAEALEPLRGTLRARDDGFVLVSMAAGLTMEKICALAGGDYPIIRIMPNTPCAVGAGVVLYDTNSLVTEKQTRLFLDAMADAGVCDRLEERLIDAGSAVSGCGPAFVCEFIEALSDGGVACGLPRQKALLYAAQTVLGTARLLLETGRHPAELKDAVCSPAGSTIAGVRVLEQRAMRGAVHDAAIAACERGRELG